jgi:hypothetical protein
VQQFLLLETKFMLVHMDATAFRATVAAVYDSALLLTDVFGANGVNSVPAIGAHY